MILNYLKNCIGWSTLRKIVVIESDDWGSIRMDPKIRSSLIQQGFDLSDRYNKFDSIESDDDLTALFDTLTKHKDQLGNIPAFTAISVVANPDFDKIRESKFKEYHYKPFLHTYNDYYSNPHLSKLWKEGYENGFFIPQFHGREHLNVKGWLRSLQSADSKIRIAFNHGVWGCCKSTQNSSSIDLMAAFDLDDEHDDIQYHEDVIRSGLELFKDLHGFTSTFFVPPNGPFTASLEKVAADNGIKYMSCSKVHRDPPRVFYHRPSFRWLGKKNSYGQRYITRNAFFEPSATGVDWVDSCLNDISIAFKCFKPAVISSHRVNYIGTIDKSNQSNGLSKLDTLLQSITKHWPDVEFMTSVQLGNLIANSTSLEHHA